MKRARENGHSRRATEDRTPRGAGRRGRRRHSSALSSRELKVLELVCAGLTSREIARTLNLSINTVFVHRANIMNTLGVHKASSLVFYALQRKLVSPERVNPGHAARSLD